MTDGVYVKIGGLDALDRRMRDLPAAVRLKGARYAGRRAAQVFQKAIMAGASDVDDPSTTEQIARNAAVRFSPQYSKRTGDVMFRVGILGGARAGSADAAKGRRRRERQGVQSLAALGEIAGKGSGNPGGDTWYWRLVNFGTKHFDGAEFMEKAATRGADPARDAFVLHLGRWIDRHAAKQAGGGGK